MTGLRQALAGYLDLRRGLGFKLDRDDKLLGQFITYLEQRGSGTVTVADALAWATLPAGASPGWLRMRITVVRGFAAYLATLDPAAEVPPASLLPGGTRRAVPYLYSAADIAALIAQAERLRTPLRTGDHPDPDRLAGGHRHAGRRGARARRRGLRYRGAGLLLVRHAKFGKHRLLPLHPTTVTAVQGYRRLRDQRVPAPGQPGAAGLQRRHPAAVLQRQPDVRQAGATRGTGCPLRAAAVPGRMICGIHSRSPPCWTGAATAVTSPPGCRCCRPTSATPSPANTYWYLQAAPELLAEAARRLGDWPGEPR